MIPNGNKGRYPRTSSVNLFTSREAILCNYFSCRVNVLKYPLLALTRLVVRVVPIMMRAQGHDTLINMFV